MSSSQKLTANETTVTDHPLDPSGSLTQGTFISRLCEARTAAPVTGLASESDPVPRAPPPRGSASPRTAPKGPVFRVCLQHAGRREAMKEAQGEDRKRSLGAAHFTSAHIRLARARLAATANGFAVGMNETS